MKLIEKRISMILLFLFLYFCVLSWISYIRLPDKYKDNENALSLVKYQDFSALKSEKGTHIGQEELIFDSNDNSTKVFGARISLADLQRISIRFAVDCPAEYAGTMLHVDLYDGENYDSDEQEFTVTLEQGYNVVSELLDKGENAPDEAWLRFFILEPAEFKVEGLTVNHYISTKNDLA